MAIPDIEVFCTEPRLLQSRAARNGLLAPTAGILQAEQVAALSFLHRQSRRPPHSRGGWCSVQHVWRKLLSVKNTDTITVETAPPLDTSLPQCSGPPRHREMVIAVVR